MTAITVEKNVPMPPEMRNHYPWREMEVGDSFLVANRTRKQMQPAACRAAHVTGWRFRVGKTKSGVRVWRIR